MTIRLTCLIQIYLPFVLPRGDGWDAAKLDLQSDGLDIRIRPRSYTDPLFPNDVDQTLSSMAVHLQRVSTPTAAITILVRDRTFDRIEVYIRGEVDWHLGAIADIEESFLRTAVAAINVFLEHLRVLTGACFLGSLQEHYRLEDGKRYFLFPRSLTWFETDTSERFPFYGEVNAHACAGAFRSPEQGNITFAELLQSVRSGPVNLERSLLVDAEERLVTLRLRETILNLAVACEVSANRFLHQKGVHSDPQIAKILRSKNSFAAKRFEKIPLYLGISSLLIDDAATFDLLEQLYRARNAVAHAATLEFEHRGAKKVVDVHLATRMKEAATKAILWLDSK